MSRGISPYVMLFVSATGWLGSHPGSSAVWAVEGEEPPIEFYWPQPQTVDWQGSLPSFTEDVSLPAFRSGQRTRIQASVGGTVDRKGAFFHAGQFPRASYLLRVGSGVEREVSRFESFDGEAELGLRMNPGVKIILESAFEREQRRLWGSRADQIRSLVAQGLRVRQDSRNVQTDACLRHGRASLQGGGENGAEHRLVSFQGTSRFLLGRKTLLKAGVSLREDYSLTPAEEKGNSGTEVATMVVRADLLPGATAALGLRVDRVHEQGQSVYLWASPQIETAFRPARRLLLLLCYDPGADYRAFDDLYLKEDYVERVPAFASSRTEYSWKEGLAYSLTADQTFSLLFTQSRKEHFFFYSDRNGDTLREPSDFPEVAERGVRATWNSASRAEFENEVSFGAWSRDRRIPGVANVEGEGTLGMVPFGSLRIEVKGTYTGERTTLRSGVLPGYFLVGAQLSRHVGPNVIFSVWGENLGGRRYQKYEHLQGPGRKIGGRAQLAF